MPAETDADERRALQRKAFAPGGVLTAAEARRLRALDDALRRAAVPPPASPAPADRAADSAVSPDAPFDVVRGEQRPEPPNGFTESEPVDVVAVPEPPRRGWARPAWALGVAAVVVLALGVGIGGVLFAPRTDGITLSGEQQQRRVELAAEPSFDADSIRAVAQREGALAWYATKDGGEVHCLILDVGPRSQQDCRSTEEIDSGLMTGVPLESDDSPGELTRSDETVFARLFLSTGGEPLAAIRQWGTSTALSEQFEGVDGERAAALVEEGYDLGLTMVGRFRDRPVWLGDRLSEQGATERCLIVDALSAVTCDDYESAVSQDLHVRTVEVDADGAVQDTVDLTVRFTVTQTPYLTVATGAQAPGDRPGESFVVRVPPSDPIEVEPPGRDPHG